MTKPEMVLELIPQPQLFQQGRDFAVQSGSLEPLEEHVQVLVASAEAVSEASSRAEFDPDRFPEDLLRDLRYEANCVDLKDLRSRRMYAATRAGELEEAAMRCRAAVESKPEQPVACYMFAFAAIAFSCWPTLHDIVFANIDDEPMRVLASIITASVLAGLLVFGYLGSIASPVQAIAAGVAIGIGMFAIRMVAAHGALEGLFAFGFTLIELGALGIIHWRASETSEAIRRWEKCQKMANEAEASARQQHSEIDILDNCEKVVQSAISDHVAYVEARGSAAGNPQFRKRAAGLTVRAGYLDGIAANIGRVKHYAGRIA